MQSDFDAIVIGGGPGGATAALVLAQAGWNVAVIEKQCFPRRKVCGEFISFTNWPVLQRMGVDSRLRAEAGPEVTHFAVLSGPSSVSCELPFCFGGQNNRGRALTRDKLDTLLLEQSRKCGATVLQPWKVLSVARKTGGFVGVMQSCETREEIECRARIVIAAQGSWEGNPIEGTRRSVAREGDLFGFKAHFRGAKLADGLMPLLSFQDGYGGMVGCQDGLTSLSCCIRRGRLKCLRQEACAGAGEAVLEHIKGSCPAAIPVLDGAEREGAWLSAGPIRPGIRRRYARGIFFVGNAAGEAHPVIAEGISMAIQSAWIMGNILGPLKSQIADARAVDAAGHIYARAWRDAFARRIRASALIAHWAMHPGLVRAMLPAFERWPRVLKWFAEAAGKASLTIERHGTELQGATS
jgi:flavin-dependent dehydrogenase